MDGILLPLGLPLEDGTRAPHFLGAREKAPCFGTSMLTKRPLSSDEDLGVRGALCPLMWDYESNYILGIALSTL